MNPTPSSSSGGINISNVQGAVKIKAGGHIVGGDQTITEAHTTKGFSNDAEKEQFQVQIEELRKALREIKASLEAQAGLDQDDRDALVTEIMGQLAALRDTKEQAVALAAGVPAPPEIVAKVENALGRAGGVIEKVRSLAEKAGSAAGVVANLALAYGPLLAKARHLFHLP